MDQETHPAIKATRLHRIPACSGGSCQQGQEPCKTPEACLLPEPEADLKDPAKAIVYALTLAVALLGVAAALFG